jgi:hypothetical protein
MKRRKQRTTVYDLGRVPLTPVENKSGWESAAEMKARWEREEREAKERPIREAIQKLEVTSRHLNRVLAQYWSRPIAELAKTYQTDVGKDFGFVTDATVESYDLSQAQAGFSDFFDNLLPQTEYTLNRDGATRVVFYGICHAVQGADMTSAKSWNEAFLRLIQLNAFGNDELTIDPDKVKVVPVVPSVEKPVLSERHQIEADMLDEMAPIAQSWLASLKDRWDFIPSTSDLKLIFGTNTQSRILEERGLFFKLGLNPLRVQDYTKIRRYMVTKSYWPQELRTVDEILSDEIERNPTPLEHMTTDDRFNLISSLERIRPRVQS